MQEIIETYLNESYGTMCFNHSEIGEYLSLCETFEDLKPIKNGKSYHTLGELDYINHKRIERLKKKQERKKNLEEIAEKAGISTSRLKEILKEAGFK